MGGNHNQVIEEMNCNMMPRFLRRGRQIIPHSRCLLCEGLLKEFTDKVSTYIKCGIFHLIPRIKYSPSSQMALTDKNIPQCNDEGQASEPDFGDKALMRANIGEKAEKP